MLDNQDANELREMIDWQVKFPGYVFNNKALRGFLALESSMSNYGFLDFMLTLARNENDGPLRILVRPSGPAPTDLTFSASNSAQISEVRTGLMHSELDLFSSIIVVTAAPSKWVVYEDTAEDFTVIAVFDDETWRRWTSKDSGIWDHAICKDQIAARLTVDEWPGWERDFLAEILASYGQAHSDRD